MYKESSGKSIYLDMIGGIAGDMFIAAMGSMYPDLEELCTQWANDIHGVPDNISVKFSNHSKNGLFGRRFTVDQEGDVTEKHSHVGFTDALDIVRATEMPRGSKMVAEHIFEILARSEGAMHNVEYTAVMFHEIGGWDSVIDIILSARIIDELNCENWNCGPIPIGSGSINFSHGILPVPAPATLHLLQDFSVYQDGNCGERVTPTGAAILKHLAPKQHSGLPIGKLDEYGTGYGSKSFEGFSNALRVYSTSSSNQSDSDSVAVIEFDVDDQTPEDLALGLRSVRNAEGVLDVAQFPYYGKKGRLGINVRVLTAETNVDAVLDKCLSATSTIGVRWYYAQRRILRRSTSEFDMNDIVGTVKTVVRPDDQETHKIEADNLGKMGSSYGIREKLRARVQDLKEASNQNESKIDN